MYEYIYAKVKINRGYVSNARSVYIFSDEKKIIVDKKENVYITKKETGIPDGYRCIAVRKI